MIQENLQFSFYVILVQSRILVDFFFRSSDLLSFRALAPFSQFPTHATMGCDQAKMTARQLEERVRSGVV
jgi:hypothetical protein